MQPFCCATSKNQLWKGMYNCKRVLRSFEIVGWHKKTGWRAAAFRQEWNVPESLSCHVNQGKPPKLGKVKFDFKSKIRCLKLRVQRILLLLLYCCDLILQLWIRSNESSQLLPYHFASSLLTAFPNVVFQPGPVYDSYLNSITQQWEPLFLVFWRLEVVGPGNYCQELYIPRIS